jgi:outer membrane protein assembly factor BamC
MLKMPFRPIALALTMLVLSAGCSTKDAPRSSVDYRDNKVLPTLVVPPDLTAPGDSKNVPVPGTEIGTASMRASAKDVPELTDTKVLPEVDNVRFRSAGDLRWLEVRGSPDEVFQAAKAFIAEQGLTIADANDTLGRIETGWAESKPGLQPKWSISRWLDKWSKSDYRDRFSLWMERSDKPGLVNVYLTHYGLERAFVDPDVNPEAFQNLQWQTRPSDPALEAEMLTRLAVYLGLSDSRARQLLADAEREAIRARIVLDEERASPYLLIEQPFETAWARTVNALDRNGVSIASLSKDRGRIEIGRPDTDGLKLEDQSPLRRVDFGTRGDPKFYTLDLAAIGQGTTRLDVGALQDEGGESESQRRLLQFMEQELR